ncbi:MAG: S8 family serine peptidase [Bdellovibrionales bacterium]|nr:S8 family serine peptidase [Bdellovibrionales bacterium]
MMERHGRHILILAIIGIGSGCGVAREPDSRGTLAVIDGKVQQVSEKEKATICSENFCEPNYVYSVSFGRTRPEPPRTNPAPNPVRTPGATPAQPYEQLDYSRQILRVPDAWNMSVGTDDIVVAVIDTGVDYTHVDLRNNIWRSADGSYGFDFVGNRANAYDDNKHGTHCAGIIGAEKNGIGVVGVNQRVKIMPVKFMDSRGSGDTMAAIKAIDYAVANGAKVISNSWGGGGYSSLLNDAIQRAIAKGVYVVAAAGNEANDNDSRATYPANYPGVISVASTDQNDELSVFSNFGSKNVFIAAPGSSINSSVPGGYYESMSGTSMAAPQVAGAIALALSVNRNITRAQMMDALCSGATKILTNKTVCGRMDVAQLVANVARL